MNSDPMAGLTGPERYFLRTVGWSRLFVISAIVASAIVMVAGAANMIMGVIIDDSVIKMLGGLIFVAGGTFLVQMSAVVGAKRYLARTGIMPQKSPEEPGGHITLK